MVNPFDPSSLLQPRRHIDGISAVLLPFDEAGEIDWDSFRSLLVRTVDAGLTVAVNMDTGYVNLLTDAEKAAVLDLTSEVLGGAWFVAGAYLGDEPGDPFDPGAYQRETERIESAGGTPVIFPSYGLGSRHDFALDDAYKQIAAGCDRFIAFELGEMFAPFGRIHSLREVLALMAIPNCIGMKHSSLDRGAEWIRLKSRNETRTDFTIYTGNDLAIDMVMYGSDYLLGLSAFAPDAFARRDKLWEAGDARFYALNDALQYLGAFAFREPVPAYKHTAAQFLRIRGWLPSDTPHPRALRRPDTDRDILRALLDRLDALAS